MERVIVEALPVLLSKSLLLHALLAFFLCTLVTEL